MRVAVLVLAAHAATAHAMPASRCQGDAWRAAAGSLSPGAACGRFVISTELRARGGSIARLEHRTLAGTGDVLLAVTVRALTADDVILELQLPGGYLLVKDGALGIYTSEAEWAAQGWRPFPAALAGHRLGDGLAISLAIHGTSLTVTLDGIAVGTFPLAKRPTSQVITLAVTGDAARRARVLVSETSLIQPSTSPDGPAPGGAPPGAPTTRDASRPSPAP